MTQEQWEALPDAEKDAAVAKALAWTHDAQRLSFGQLIGSGWCRHGKAPENGPRDGSPPPYVTGGDADPYARWDLIAEMVKALGKNTILSLLGPLGTPPPWVVAGRDACGEDATPHRALAAAMVAAGLVGDSDGD